LLKQLDFTLNYIQNLEKSNAELIDLAAGIGWCSAEFSKLNCINKVHAVEISKHRLDLLFPKAMKMFDGVNKKVNRYLGSFYDIKLPSKSIDIVFMSQAFHHAENPFKLMCESDRLVKDDGTIILMGEHYIGYFRMLKRIVSHFMKTGKINFNFHKLWKPDIKLGDHYYRVKDYYFMFEILGYDLTHIKIDSNSVIYIANKICKN
jgi:ubiquinone/menaquinone biosynthesis C-methylase UbiE